MKLNIKETIMAFDKTSKLHDHHRYLTFDLCHDYFRSNRECLADSDHLEMSCYVLWSYLASWGMLRGSSYLLQRNPAFLVPLIKLIATDEECQNLFDIDVDKYMDVDAEGKPIDNGNIDMILRCYEKIGESLFSEVGGRNATKTLITKIMLGVFACIPAFDRYLKKTFCELEKEGEVKEGGFGSPTLKNLGKSLVSIFIFYIKYKEEIDALLGNLRLMNFYVAPTKYNYSIAKTIDMFGFQRGFEVDEKKKLYNKNNKTK